MTKFKQLVSAEAAFATLQSALESELNDTNADVEATQSLPPELCDAAACLEWGRSVLAAGLRFPTTTPENYRSDDEEYRMAARNGVPIPQDVLQRMHAERLVTEQQEHLDADVEN